MSNALCWFKSYSRYFQKNLSWKNAILHIFKISKCQKLSTQSYILLICREYLFQLQQKLFCKFILIYLYLHPIENTISLQDDPKCTHYFTWDYSREDLYYMLRQVISFFHKKMLLLFFYYKNNKMILSKKYKRR